MKANFTFRQMDSSDPLKSRVTEKLEKLQKYNIGEIESSIVFKVEGHRHLVEINFSASQFKTFAKSETNDMYSSIDDAINKVEQSIRKHSDKNTA